LKDIALLFLAVHDRVGVVIMDHSETVAAEITAGTFPTIGAGPIIPGRRAGPIHHKTGPPHRLIRNTVPLNVRLEIEQMGIGIVAGIVGNELGRIQADIDRIARLDIAMDVIMAFMAAGVGSTD
jgi:hypothetical protein